MQNGAFQGRDREIRGVTHKGIWPGDTQTLTFMKNGASQGRDREIRGVTYKGIWPGETKTLTFMQNGAFQGRDREIRGVTYKGIWPGDTKKHTFVKIAVVTYKGLHLFERKKTFIFGCNRCNTLGVTPQFFAKCIIKMYNILIILLYILQKIEV